MITSAHIGYVVLGIGMAGVTWFLAQRRRYSISSVTIPFGLGSVVMQPTGIEREVAWKLYVELRTRKAALPFDEDHDIIADVYESLYELFPIIRALLSAIPASQLGCSHRLVDLILRVQSDGLRRHLTCWQGAFRHWWLSAITDPANAAKSPQEIQRLYPGYSVLVEDLKSTNTSLSQFADELYLIARPPRGRRWRLRGRKHVRPEAPVVMDEVPVVISEAPLAAPADPAAPAPPE